MEWQMGFMSCKMLSNNCNRTACIYIRKRFSTRFSFIWGQQYNSKGQMTKFVPRKLTRQSICVGFFSPCTRRPLFLQIFGEIWKSRLCNLLNILWNSCIWKRSFWSMVWFWPLGGVRETCCISHGGFYLFICHFFNCWMHEPSWWVKSLRNRCYVTSNDVISMSH